MTPSRAVALSGGADSLATAALMPPGRAYIVDHGLRRESAHEAQRAAALARDLGHQPQIIPLAWASRPRTQAAYRHARLAALAVACARDGIDQIWMGHHRDDQAETLWLRMERGSGLMGLSAMAYAQPFGRAWLIRPLLTTPKVRIKDWLRTKALSWIEDPSNTDPRYARTAARQALASRPGLSADLAQLATRLGRLRAQVVDEASQVPIHILNRAGLTLPRAALAGLSRASAHELLRACVQWCGGQAFPSMATHRDLLEMGQGDDTARGRSSGGGVIMEWGTQVRLAPECRDRRQQTPAMQDLAAAAAAQRQAQTSHGMWLPQPGGARRLPFVATQPQIARLYATDQTPCPFDGAGWIDLLTTFPM